MLQQAKDNISTSTESTAHEIDQPFAPTMVSQPFPALIVPSTIKEVFKEEITIADSIVSKETANKIVNAQYVNLSKLLIKDDFHEQGSHVTVCNDDLKVGKCNGPPIENYDLWIEAMLNYEALLSACSSDNQISASLAVYRRTIHMFQTKFLWAKVYLYDQKFRAELARLRSFDFHATSVVIFMQVFDAKSLKPDNNGIGKRCHRCDSTTHLVRHCSFQAQAKNTTQAAAAAGVKGVKGTCYKCNDGTLFFIFYTTASTYTELPRNWCREFSENGQGAGWIGSQACC